MKNQNLKNINEQLRREVNERKKVEESLRKHQEKLKKQLSFASALNRIAEATLLHDDTPKILEAMAEIVGETLGVDRSLIYDMDFDEGLVIGLCEWLNPQTPGIQPTRATYDMRVFSNGTAFMKEKKQYAESHADAINPLLLGDGSAELLHTHMRIKSGLWYPFSFHPRGYYCLVFNQVSHRRVWQEEEINFLGTVAKQVEIVLQKILFLEERARAEQIMQEQLHFAQRLMDTIPSPLFYKDTKGFYQGCNTAFEAYTCLKKKEIIGKSVYDLWPKDLADKYHEMDSRLLRDPGIQVYEFSVANKDNSRHEVIFNKATYLNSGGAVAGLVGVFTDITARKRMEEELRYRSEFEKLITTISTTFINLRPEEIDSGISHALQAIGEFTGVERCYIFLFDASTNKLNNTHEWCAEGIEPQIEKLKGLNPAVAPWWMNKMMQFENIYIPRIADLPPEAAQESTILQGQGIQSLVAVPMAYGRSLIGFLGFDSTRSEKKWSEGSIALLKILGEIFANALERKRGEEALEAERRRLFSLLEGLPVLVCLQAPDYSFRFANRYFREYFGEPAERPCYKTFEGRERPCESCPPLQVLKTQSPADWEWTRPNGQTFHLYFFPFTDIDGSPLVLQLGIDITESKQMEQEMARLDRLTLIGEMAATIGHEVRNPLTTVRGFLQMLGEKYDCAKHKEYFDLMIEELDRANSIITQYLALGRNRPVHKKKQNLNTIVETILPLLRADATKAQKTIRLALKPTPDLLLDDKEIRQLILNLVLNGLEATPARSILTIESGTEEETVVLSVRDQGQGIEPEVLGKIGTPFFTTKEQGTGLGLAVCYSIATRHNATIKVDTGPGGTSFSVFFKLSKR